MDNEFLQISGFPALQFEPTFWPSMSIHPTDQDLCQNQTRDSFFLENSTEQSVYDSTLTSLVSSPAASNSNISGAGAGDGFIIRELIGKLGNIGNCSVEMFNGNGIGSHYGTPMSSPPHLTPQNLNLPTATDFYADPGFAERAARFSCFGSRSFNGRTSPFAVNPDGGLNGSDFVDGSNRNNGDLTRVTSSLSLNGNKNSGKEESSFPGEHILARNSCPRMSGKLSRKRKSSSRGKPIENSSSATPSPNTTKESEICEASDSKRSKPSEADCSVKTEQVEERNEKKQSKTNSTKPTEPLKDFIHVRARRGEATDSHSLAERARREKISERMKLLQDLVPGCNKVTGKALMLDEIINYVQSLQRQVEFLAMKLASVNTRLDFNVDVLKSKDIPESNKNNGIIHHVNVPFECSAATLEPSGLSRSFNARLPPLAQFTDMGPMFSQDDLQTIAHMGFGPFGQNMDPDTDIAQDFHGSGQEFSIKTEL